MSASVSQGVGNRPQLPLVSVQNPHFSFCFFLSQIVNYAYRNNTASVYPEPKDKEAFVLSQTYSSDYDSFTLDTYEWPEEAMKVQDV